ncbi:MAG: hypothetical protein ACI8PT_002170 [Gammaproteobacteria bacterium]|jgi:hypothetical protein
MLMLGHCGFFSVFVTTLDAIIELPAHPVDSSTVNFSFFLTSKHRSAIGLVIPTHLHPIGLTLRFFRE